MASAIEQAQASKPTVGQAKSMLRNFLFQNHIPFSKVTGRTVGFQDLARDDAIFVKIHGWRNPTGAWSKISTFAREHHFIVETDGDFG